MFITFEGIDGSGKSTQARMLWERLASTGRDVVLTREPGGAPGAEDIRKLLVEGDPGRWSAETEILLFTAARRDHLERTIRPALDRGAVVISDRFADSTRVYQGATRGDLRDTVDALHDLMIGVEPDITLILDTDPDAALARGLARKSGEDRFEDMGARFQHTLREGFCALAQDQPERCILIDGDRPVQIVSADIAHRVEARL
ncbi:dTMP kinase [Pontivivens nitratireducens]|uniref:dTMP kinase n=1 Tax=Pontivivens nitratireducens TaxID=2758038 RepID=UPI0016399388|nr:dTMP kinase [Pontibrevibacter nitratireducens]